VLVPELPIPWLVFPPSPDDPTLGSRRLAVSVLCGPDE